MEKAPRRKIGIMGGTFDPIHIGHLILGEKAYEQFDLEKVLFMPSGNPPHKTDRSGGASNEERSEMVRRAIAGNSHFALSMEEMHELGYIYTSKTLTRLTRRHPDTDYYFIMGADSLISFDTWKDPQVICDHCVIVVAVRDHMPQESLDAQIAVLRSRYRADIRKLSTLNIDISSHMIRQWVREGKSCRYYLPESVECFIRQKRLYQGEA